MIENPCLECLVGMVCTNKCKAYHEAIKDASYKVYSWTSTEINRFRKSVGADFLHTVEDTIKKRVLHKRNWCIK
jgi:hypothetical protein